MKITALLLALPAAAFAQGPLAPPTAPAPSMKTLDQIEPRTPIPATPANETTSGHRSHFIIKRSGSYYLTSNISAPFAHDGIVIADGVSDVTLDLNGFTITVDTYHGGIGIYMVGSHSRITIYNGSISSEKYDNGPGSWNLGGGIVGDHARNVLVHQIHVMSNTGYGIKLGAQSIISECSANKCSNIGLVAETVTNSNASNCSGGGISAKNATNCSGVSTGSSSGLHCSGNATNCSGVSNRGPGLLCEGNTTNCRGSSYEQTGLECYGNAINCMGVSFYKTGLSCGGNASNCSGKAGEGNGLFVKGTANACTGDNSILGTTALTAGIAIGCTSTSGTISSPQKHLGTL